METVYTRKDTRNPLPFHPPSPPSLPGQVFRKNCESPDMVMTALAWNLKAWWALTLPEGRGSQAERCREDKEWVLGLEFKTFVNAFVRLPCQVIRTGRKLVYRLLGWNPHVRIFFRLVGALRC